MTTPREAGWVTGERVERDPEQDKELVLSFQAGADGAYDAIYRLYAARIQRLCRRMLVRPEDAEEAVQETFLRVFLALPRFNGRYQLGSWMTRIATNVCLDRIRSRSRRPVDPAALDDLENDIVDGADSDPELRTLRNAESRRVTRVLLRLPALHRAAIVLRDIEGMSYAEVAQTLGLTEVQTKALIHRARQGFKRSWTSAATAFLPARLVNRVRDAVDSTRNQIADLVSPAGHAAAQCSLLVQQCGNYFVDKAASLTTAAVVTGAVGAAGVTGAIAVASTGHTPAQAVAEQTSARPAAPPQGRTDLGRSGAGDSSTRVVEPPPPSAPPAPTTTPSPSSSPEPSAEPSPSADPTAEPQKATPSPSPTPPPTASLPTADVRFDQGQAAAPRAALGGRSSADCGTRKVSQTLDVLVSTSKGDYRGKLTLSINGAAGFELDVVDGSYSVHYAGGGPLDRIEQPNPGTLRFLSSGMFGTGSPHAAGLGLPDSGRFSLDLTLDCASASVVTETLVFQR